MKQINFNSGWQIRHADAPGTGRPITLPHDAMLEETRAGDHPSGSGEAYFAGNAYVYEKHFDVPSDWQEQRVILRFEGICPEGRIFINDRKAADVFYGYTVTDVHAESFLLFGRENTIRVEVDNSAQPCSRWYSGAGIIRPVTLFVLPKDGIDLDGIRIETVSTAPARIHVTTSTHGEGSIRLTVLKDGIQKAEGEGSDVTIQVPAAQLWDAEHPDLYTLRAEIVEDGTTLDMQEVRFGIRMISWSADGLFVNGKNVLLQGGCIHHDNGVLGACGYPEAEARRIRILKENGFNAIRSAHNPCTSSMLDACDEIGMYVMDEGWDMWTRHKTAEDYADRFPSHWREDAASMVRKDYNHPSVLMYSIGNEVSEPADKDGFSLEKDLVAAFHSQDPSRPVTCGINLMILANAAKGQQMYDGNGNLNAGGAAAPMDSTQFNQIAQMVGQGMNHAADSDEADAAISPALDALDIAGYNYGSGRYPLDATKHPDRVIVGSETLPPDLYDNWEMVKKYPALVGDFMWTAWDYLGEVGIGAWSDRPDAGSFNKPYPWLLAESGVISILGDPDGEALRARTIWNPGKEVYIAVRPVNMDPDKTYHSVWRGTNAIPSWSFRGCEGKKAVVEVYGNGSSTELFLNGKSIGKKALEKNQALFETTWAPGNLRAVVYDAEGNTTGEESLSSAAGPLMIRIMPEQGAAAGKLLFVRIDLAGAENGIIDSASDDTLDVTVEGGTLLGFGSACPCTEESFVTGHYTTWHGRSLAVIRPDDSGRIRIHVKGTGKTAEKNIEVSR